MSKRTKSPKEKPTTKAKPSTALTTVSPALNTVIPATALTTVIPATEEKSPPWDWAKHVSVEELVQLALIGGQARRRVIAGRLAPPPSALASVVGHLVLRALHGWEPSAKEREELVEIRPRWANAVDKEGARTVLARWLRNAAKVRDLRPDLAVLALAAVLALEDHDAVKQDAFDGVVTTRPTNAFRGKLVQGLRSWLPRLQVAEVRLLVLDVIGGVWARPADDLDGHEGLVIERVNRAHVAATPMKPELVLLPETRRRTSGTQNRVRIVPLEGPILTDWLASSGAKVAPRWGRGEKIIDKDKNGRATLVEFLDEHKLPNAPDLITVTDARGR